MSTKEAQARIKINMIHGYGIYWAYQTAGLKGENSRFAVKIVDERSIESLKVIEI